jgi:hypothetical protein
MKPYGIKRQVLAGYDRGTEYELGKRIGHDKSFESRHNRKQAWKGKARMEAKQQIIKGEV